MSSRLPHPLAPLTFIIHPSCFGQRNGGGLCVTRHGRHLALPKCWKWCLWVPGEGEEGRFSEVGRPWRPAAIAWQGSPLLLRPQGGAAGAAAAPQRCLSLLLPGGEAALSGGAVVAYHCSCCSCFAAWKSRRLLLERRYGLGGVKGCCRYCCPEEQLILRPQHSCSAEWPVAAAHHRRYDCPAERSGWTACRCYRRPAEQPARGCGYRPVEQPPGGAIRRRCCPEAAWRQLGRSPVLLLLLPGGSAGHCCHRNATERLVTTNVALPPCGVARRCHHGRLVGRTGAAATEEALRKGPPMLLSGEAAIRCCHGCC